MPKKQFVVIGYDASDDNALDRRMAARDAHLDLVEKMRNAGQMLYGAALMDDNEKMIGSFMIGEFDSREEVDQWLKIEPYVTGNVWQKIEVSLCKVGPSFTSNKS